MSHIMHSGICLTRGQIKEKLLIEIDAILVPGITEAGDVISDDPSDHLFLSCAIEGNADAIVSGDRHLLNLKKFNEIPVICVNEFIDLLIKNES